MLTYEQVAEKLDYHEKTGIFTRNSGVRKGMEAGSLHYEGYIKIYLFGHYVSAHRLAWLFVHKEMPIMSIDHINGNKSDNRICNLRLATGRQNSENRVGPSKANTTGFLGVTRTKCNKRFVAQISVAGKTKHIGTFDTPQIAYEKYLEAKRKHHEFCSI